MAARYAKTTKVPVDRSIGEIRRVLDKFGCKGFGWMEDKGWASIAFTAAHYPVKVVFPCPDQNDCVTPDMRQKRKQAYRILLLLVKSKLELIEAGMETVQTAFMPYLVLPSGRTLGDLMMPDIDDYLKSGKVPNLLQITQ